MTVFVAGVHGVGKTYLCQQYARKNGVIHESASGLILKEKARADWSLDKKAAEINDNQIALTRGVQKILKLGVPLLLDGHFVLIDARGDLVSLAIDVFSGLGLSGVILIEAREQLIIDRIAERDSAKSAVDVRRFLELERAHAQFVCDSLSLPLHILHEPEIMDFSDSIGKVLNLV